jgi:hypothetical protein
VMTSNPQPESPDRPDRRRAQRVRWWLYQVTRAVPMVTVAAGVLATLLAFASTAYAASDSQHPVVLAADSLQQVVNNLRVWLVGILAALATLFLTIGALRYLAAGGNPGEVERAKSALKSAAIGYALALLAPVLISLVAKLVS